jgi:hypothetical protein
MKLKHYLLFIAIFLCACSSSDTDETVDVTQSNVIGEYYRFGDKYSWHANLYSDGTYYWYIMVDATYKITDKEKGTYVVDGARHITFTDTKGETSYMSGEFYFTDASLNTLHFHNFGNMTRYK